jgi:uncharacterized Zn-finger protein
MQVQCVHCGKQYSLSDENAGSHFRCRSCGKLSPVSPGESAAEAVFQPPRVAAEAVENVLAVACASCGERYRLRTSAAGKQFKCRCCGALTAVAPPKAARPRRTQPPNHDALPVAKVVSSPHAPFVPVPAATPNMLAQALPSTSNYILSPAPVVRAPPPKPATKKKSTWRKKKRVREEASSDWNDDGMLSGFRPIIGLMCIFGGCGLLFYVYQCFQKGEDPPRRSIGASLMLIIGGIRMVFS